MISLTKINKIGYGFGFGGAFATNLKYTKGHSNTLNYFCDNSEGNFIDTSINYGNGDSEKLIGKLSREIKKKIFISTKVDASNLTYKKFIKSSLRSLKNLNVKKIDLIQPHWPNYKIPNSDLIKAFKYLKKKRKVRYFGLSNYDLKDIKFFKKKLGGSFKFVQEEFSIRDRELEKKIKYFEKHNLKIICYSPLGTGGLVFTKKEKSLLGKLSKKYKKSFFSIILNYLLSKSKNILLIPHTTKINHLEDNLDSKNYKIVKKDLKKLDRCFKTNYIKLKLKEVNFYNKKYTKITSLNDALTNKGHLSPSPKILASRLREGYKVKPVKLKKIKNEYHIKEGRLRYWAHVIAFGWDKKLEMVVT
jgi:pyridoxine 4-dehydrogenase